MDYSKKTVKELIEICKDNNIRRYSGKKKTELIQLLITCKIIHTKQTTQSNPTNPTDLDLILDATDDVCDKKNDNDNDKANDDNKDENINKNDDKTDDDKSTLVPLNTLVKRDSVYRLNYIGSKFQLLNWILASIKSKTGWQSFSNKTICDLFAGTGIVSYNFRNYLARVISNDANYIVLLLLTHLLVQSIQIPAKKLLKNLKKIC